MSAYLLLVLQAAAVTVVFVRGTIFRRIRESGPALWRELASCALCAGVWIGAAWRAIHPTSTALRAEALDALATGAGAGVLALLLVLVLSVLDRFS